MLLLVAIGVPVAIALGAVAAIGMWWFGGIDFMLTNLTTLPYNNASQYTFVVVPMFIFMGALAATSGITTELYNAAYRWTSGLRGSLYYATTFASAGFAAINGATIVSALVFTRIALPEMLRFGYHRGLSGGCICAAGTFAALIPPSIIIILYALLADESVGQLLLAGVVPGIVTVIVYTIGLSITLRIRPDLAPETIQRFSMREKLESLRGLWPIVVLVILVLGGIYSGLMFPSAAGAVGAVGVLIIGLMRGRLTGAGIWKSLQETAVSTAVLFLIIVGGLLLSRELLVTGFITDLTDIIEQQSISKWAFIVAVFILYIILGMFIDTISMMVMTIPILHPIAQHLEIDGIWFGIIVVKLIEIGSITPPVGLNLYAVLSAAQGQVTANDLFKGVVPFIIYEAVTLGLLLGFPELSLWLPESMKQ